MADTPRNIDELAAIKDPSERAQAAERYQVTARGKIRQAQRLRNDAIVELFRTTDSPTKVARQSGMSVSHVKVIRDQARRDGDL